MAGYASAVLGTSGLVSYWKFNESSGTTAADSSGNGHDALSAGATLGAPGLVTNENDTAYSFDGSNDSVKEAVGLPSIVYSMEAWVQNRRSHTAQDITGYPIARGALTGTAGSAFDAVGIMGNFVPTHRGKFFVFNGTSLVYGTTVTATNATYHIVFARGNVSVKLYVNGLPELETALSATYTAGSVAVGVRTDSFGYFDGVIDDVSTYSRALQDADVATHYDIGTSPPLSSTRRFFDMGGILPRIGPAFDAIRPPRG